VTFRYHVSVITSITYHQRKTGNLQKQLDSCEYQLIRYRYTAYVGSISAALSCPVYVPPWKEMAGDVNMQLVIEPTLYNLCRNKLIQGLVSVMEVRHVFCNSEHTHVFAQAPVEKFLQTRMSYHRLMVRNGRGFAVTQNPYLGLSWPLLSAK